MKDKYYTPTIEEFHVGFEYFENQKKDKFYLSDDIYKMQKRIRSGFIKVKHLDREDIESLGFKFKEGTESSYVKDNITMHVYDAKRWNTKNDTITIFKKDLTRTVGKTIVFSGTIKNKSELKRLLKQLNI